MFKIVYYIDISVGMSRGSGNNSTLATVLKNEPGRIRDCDIFFRNGVDILTQKSREKIFFQDDFAGLMLPRSGNQAHNPFARRPTPCYKYSNAENTY